MLIDFRERGGEGEGKGNIHAREKYWKVASPTCPSWGLNLQPRHVPWLGIKPTTFWFTGPCSNQLSHTSQGCSFTFVKPNQFLRNLFLVSWELFESTLKPGVDGLPWYYVWFRLSLPLPCSNTYTIHKKILVGFQKSLSSLSPYHISESWSEGSTLGLDGSVSAGANPRGEGAQCSPLPSPFPSLSVWTLWAKEGRNWQIW